MEALLREVGRRVAAESGGSAHRPVGERVRRATFFRRAAFSGLTLRRPLDYADVATVPISADGEKVGITGAV
jgi:hypothetical protein